MAGAGDDAGQDVVDDESVVLLETTDTESEDILLLDGIEISGYIQTDRGTSYFFNNGELAFDPVLLGAAILENSHCDVRVVTETEDVRLYC